jgi:hypothetical protein
MHTQVANVLINMGDAYMKKGSLEDAAKIYGSAAAILRQQGMPKKADAAVLGLGEARRRMEAAASV